MNMDSPHLEARRQHTHQKSIWLTEEGRAAVQGWADLNGTSFSAAMETLARLNMGESPATALAPLVASVVRRAVLSQMDRFAKLTTVAAIQSGIASLTARAALRMSLQDRARSHPQDFPDNVFDIVDGDPAEEAYHDICDSARRDAVRSLKGPLEVLAPDAGSLEELLAALLHDPAEAPDVA